MNKIVTWATVFAFVAAILQSTILSRLAIYHAIPDLTLGVLLFTAYLNGPMTGQITGFSSGLILDFLSAAPLGFNMFIRTFIGALTGLLKGTFFLDVLILPMVLCGLGTLVKAILVLFLRFLFGPVIPIYSFFEPTLWIEVALNALTAPFLFAFLKLFKPLLLPRKDV
jgi:rod shape-determining protein MreD